MCVREQWEINIKFTSALKRERLLDLFEQFLKKRGLANDYILSVKRAPRPPEPDEDLFYRRG